MLLFASSAARADADAAAATLMRHAAFAIFIAYAGCC